MCLLSAIDRGDRVVFDSCVMLVCHVHVACAMAKYHFDV